MQGKPPAESIVSRIYGKGYPKNSKEGKTSPCGEAAIGVEGHDEGGGTADRGHGEQIDPAHGAMDQRLANEQAGCELSKPGQQHEAAGEHMRIKANTPRPNIVDALLGLQETDVAAHSCIREREPDHEDGEEGQAQERQDLEK